jgi:hypothetical protein
MSEKLSQHHEQAAESINTSKETANNANRLQEAAEHAKGSDKAEVERLRHSIKEKAVSGKEVTVGEKHETTTSSTVTRELKQQSYKKTLQRVRAKLNTPQRAFSKVIHQPVIEKVSVVTAETVARPSGILGGATFAFLGSLALLIIAKQLGFTYNYLAFLGLFVGGFAVGLIVELLYRAVRPAKKR